MDDIDPETTMGKVIAEIKNIYHEIALLKARSVHGVLSSILESLKKW